MSILQETKRPHFDAQSIKQLCPLYLNKPVFLTSNEASRGSIVIWNESKFDGELIFENEYAQSVLFTSLHSGESWVLTNVHAPCIDEGRVFFIEWFIVGDFDLIRKLEGRNKPAATVNNILMFNTTISALGMVEIPLKGRQFTWSNKQESPLLERLDLFFTSFHAK
jgi:hypothetical protein